MTSRITLAVLIVAFALPLAVRAQGLSPEKREEAVRLINEGQGMLADGRIPEARERFRRARSLDPFEVLAPFLLAQCDVNEAESRMDLLWAVSARKNLEAAMMVNPEFGGSYFLWGLIGGRIGDFEASILGFGEALKRGYRVLDSRVGLAQALLGRGGELIADPDADGESTLPILNSARNLLLKLKEDPRFDEPTRRGFREQWVTALTHLAAAHQRLEEYEEAQAILEDLVAMEPKNHQHRFNLGKLYGTRNQFAKALEAYAQALEACADPDWLEPHPMMAAIHSLEKRREEAEKHFRLYLAKYPDDWGALHRLADHYARNGEYESAIRTFRRCLEIEPGFAEVMMSLAEVCDKAGKEADAAKWKSLYEALTAERAEK